MHVPVSVSVFDFHEQDLLSKDREQDMVHKGMILTCTVCVAVKEPEIHPM